MRSHLRYVRDVLYAVLYVRVRCFVVRRCGVLRRNIDVCYCFLVSSIHILVNLLYKKNHYLYHDIQTQLHLVI